MKIVINTCFGGFSLSEAAFQKLKESGVPVTSVYDRWFDENRAYPPLVQIVEEMGEQANGCYAELAVIEVPDSVEWFIDEYDGLESVHEKHQVWR